MSEIVVTSNYKPTTPASVCHGSSDEVQVWVGGLGSGKSYALIKELEMLAIEHPGIPMAMYRKTLPSLRDSTLHEFKTHVDEELGKWRERDVQHRFHNGSFLNFRGLDEESKAKSTNYAVVVMEEAEEFSFSDFERLNERVRAMRKEGDKREKFPLKLILLLNPVDESHWIYKEFVDNAEIWRAAGGLLVQHFSTYDNIDNLPPGYIEKVSAGKNPEEVARYIHGQWGTIVKGESVYGKLLNPDIHLRRFERFPGQTLLRGWDFGFNHPAVSFRLVDEFGRMNVAHERLGEKIHLEDFAPQIIQMTTQIFGTDKQIYDYGDPRGHDKGQGKRETAFEVLKDFGIHALGERGSREYVEEGITQVKKNMSTLIQGVPKLTIDPACTYIRAAYFGKYVRQEDGRPKKDGFYEHIADADRYIDHHHRHNDAVRAAIKDFQTKRESRKFMRNPITGY